MVSQAFLLALAVRSLSLLFPQTFFQPDEFYQSLEPAHQLIFGYGYLTWEWKDLPGSTGHASNISASSLEDAWESVVVAGRMRGWLYPGVFAAIYKILQVLSLDGTQLLAFAPRLVGVLIASLTDYSTYRLSWKLLGPGSAAGALFLSLTSLFNAHLLPRSLSTSPETLLTTLALVYFPLPSAEPIKSIIVGEERLKATKSMRNVRRASQAEVKKAEANGEGDVIGLDDAAELDHSLMDRMDEKHPPRASLELSIVFAALAICIRPTTLPFWAYMGVNLLYRTYRPHGLVEVMTTASKSIPPLVTVIVANIWLDYSLTGRMMIPALTFVHRNVFQNIASFYGSTQWFYHLTQSLPIMLFPIWYWWAKGFISCLLPSSVRPRSLDSLDRPASMRVLARGLLFAISILSLSPHSEWRFLHPFLPALLVYALPAMFKSFNPTIMGCWLPSQAVRQYTRLPKMAFYTCLLVPLLPATYLSMFHGRAQVEVMNVLRRGGAGEVTSLVALMPCHSTPWQSHLHTDVDAWFLTCEPPLSSDRAHTTQQDLFFSAPGSYLKNIFPHTPLPADQPVPTASSEELPSHIILFGDLLRRNDGPFTLSSEDVRTMLEYRGYEQVWRMWNGFDWAQDEPKRRGGVRIWRRQNSDTKHMRSMLVH